MTVADVIRELQKLDQSKVVKVIDHYWDTVDSAESVRDDGDFVVID